MKAILFIISIVLVIAGCVVPVRPDATDFTYYTPPAIDGAKEVNVLRAPDGMLVRSARGAIAQADPLIGLCTEPGTVYMFYSDNALVQYVPEDGTYTMFSLAAKGAVEAHNALNPESDWWDYVSVSLPGFVFDFSHDPEPTLLTIRFLNNDGSLAEHPAVPGYVYDNTFTVEEYAGLVANDGSPRAILKGDFTGWGAEDGVHVIHMQLGGDGVNIPPMTFHY